MFTKATRLVHLWLGHHVRPGDLVIDATCGNGNDTVLLAACVGDSGRVIAVDVQAEAIDATKTVLESRGWHARVQVHQMSHERLAEVLSPGELVQCAVFNLGYLPGGSKRIVTTTTGTISAHQCLVERLSPGGAILTTAYIGHPGGKEEADALLSWSRSLDGKQFSVARHEWINQEGSPPFILIIQRRPDPSIRSTG